MVAKVQISSRLMIDPKKLKDNPDNPRKVRNKETEAQLLKSIKAKGVIEPIQVYLDGNDFVIIHGHSRKRMAIAAKLAEVPYEIRPKEAATVSDMLTTNVVRAEMNPWDLYTAIFAAVGKGETKAEICAAFDLSPERLERLLALGNLAPALVDAGREGKLGLDTAKIYSRVTDKAEQVKLFGKFKDRGWELRQHLDKNQFSSKVALFKREDYVKAGGKVALDLFAGQHRDEDQVAEIYEDKEIFWKLQNEAITAKIGALQKQGFKEVVRIEGHSPPYGEFEYALNTKDKKKLVAVVCVDGGSGHVRVETTYMRKADTKSSKAEATRKKKTKQAMEVGAEKVSAVPTADQLATLAAEANMSALMSSSKLRSNHLVAVSILSMLLDGLAGVHSSTGANAKLKAARFDEFTAEHPEVMKAIADLSFTPSLMRCVVVKDVMIAAAYVKLAKIELNKLLRFLAGLMVWAHRRTNTNYRSTLGRIMQVEMGLGVFEKTKWRPDKEFMLSLPKGVLVDAILSIDPKRKKADLEAAQRKVLVADLEKLQSTAAGRDWWAKLPLPGFTEFTMKDLLGK